MSDNSAMKKRKETNPFLQALNPDPSEITNLEKSIKSYFDELKRLAGFWL